MEVKHQKSEQHYKEEQLYQFIGEQSANGPYLVVDSREKQRTMLFSSMYAARLLGR